MTAIATEKTQRVVLPRRHGIYETYKTQAKVAATEIILLYHVHAGNIV